MESPSFLQISNSYILFSSVINIVPTSMYITDITVTFIFHHFFFYLYTSFFFTSVFGLFWFLCLTTWLPFWVIWFQNHTYKRIVGVLLNHIFPKVINPEVNVIESLEF